MEQDKILTVMGSPGSGKTVTALKLARTLAARRKNVIVVFCDPFTPVIPSVLPAGNTHDISLGALLTAPGLTQTDILTASVPACGSEYISLLGYRAGEGLMHYPRITRDRALELFVSLRYLADYIIIDSATVFEADPASFVAIEVADRVLWIGTANLKGLSYFRTHSPMLADSRYQHGSHLTAIGNLRAGQDWEAVSGQYGGVDYILPYTAELEQQDNEMALLEPFFAPESLPYQTEINRILLDVFAFEVSGSRQAVKKQAPVREKESRRKKGAGFKLSFSRNRGEF